MHHFIYSTLSCKQSEPWYVDHLLSLLEIGALVSSLYTLKFAWKMTSLLVLATAECGHDLALLHIDNQPLFLQHDAAICIAVSGGKMD